MTLSPFNMRWISVMDLPFVSGTMKKTKSVPKALRPAKIQKVGPIPIPSEIELKVAVMRKASDQLKAPQIGPTTALISFDKTSDIISQEIGPKPSAKAMI